MFSHKFLHIVFTDAIGSLEAADIARLCFEQLLAGAFCELFRAEVK